ncbi:hypothetical protein M378DRAFT_650074 [Amanita muscaria Koide BX008]|uniref:Uncharacterized protein n=1 Tax=Amanita muscaria (strain Koide BX008) TaxID=946122 RepID=A0A0C2X510_AMAMK|nr:hypothetical protein M378DRAFT_650074 [Amanita muscaria Koide BX008]
MTSVEHPHQVSNSQSNMRNADEFSGWTSRQGGATRPAVGTGRRPLLLPQTHQFTITNPLPFESEKLQLSQQRRSGSDPAWLSAVKKRYNEAKARVERIQGSVTSSSPLPTASPPVMQGSTTQPKPANAASWPTAGQEKLSPSGRRQNPRLLSSSGCC